MREGERVSPLSLSLFGGNGEEGQRGRGLATAQPGGRRGKCKKPFTNRTPLAGILKGRGQLPVATSEEEEEEEDEEREDCKKRFVMHLVVI